MHRSNLAMVPVGSGGRSVRWPVRAFSLLLTLALMVTSQRVRAQSVGSTEAEFSAVFTRLGYAPQPPSRTDDGAIRHAYVHPSKVRGVGFLGAPDSIFVATIFVPFTQTKAAVDVALFLAGVCKAERCDVEAVSSWARDHIRTGEVHKARFGRIDFEMGTGTTEFPALVITADARPAFREAEVANANAVGEEHERRAAAESATALRAELQAAVTSLAPTSTPTEVIALRTRVDGADGLDPVTKSVLTKALAGKAAAAYLREGNAAVDRGDLHLAKGQAQLAEQEANSAGDAGAAAQAGALRVKVLVRQGAVAEKVDDWKGARDFYGQAVEHGGNEEATDGITRIDAHKKSAGVALALSGVPGGGQLYAGRYTAGGLFFGGTALAVLGGVLAMSSANSQYAQYKSATTANDIQSHYDSAHTAWELSLTCLGVAGALWIWNLIDAPGGAKEWNRDHVGVE